MKKILKLIGRKQLLFTKWYCKVFKKLKKQYPNAPVCLGKKARELITYVKDRLGHDRRYAIDPTKSNSELGYKPDESFVTGIDKTIKWYLDNEDWWRHIMSGEYQDWINQQYEK